MAKYVHPNMIIDSSAAFLKNVTFDSSVYFQGVTHINAPAAVSSQTPFALVLESGSGTDLQVKSVQLGTMAKETAATWDASLSAIRTDIGYLETSVGNLDSLTQDHTALLAVHETSIGVLTQKDLYIDSSLNALWVNQLSQDASIVIERQKWIDSNRSGFVDRSQTTLSFTDTTGTVTLTDVGPGWSYYRDGIKYTISGNKSVALPGGGSAVAGVYYITIEGTDGALTVDTTVWDLNDPNVLPVSIIIWNASNSPKYWMADERHTMLIDRKMHQYLHTTQGTKLVAGGTLDGPDVSVNTNAANAIGWETTTIADEDIFLNIAALARPNGTSNNYVVFYRTDANTWTWKQENTPLSENGSFIEWDNAGTLTTGQTGKYYTSYVGFTDLNDAARVIIIPGRGEYDTLDAARDEDVTTFDFTTLPAREFVLAWKLVWRADTAYTTYGKAVAAAEPIRVQVNVTTSSGATTESHNDLLGLQGGTSTERYHLSAAQYNDYIGESEVLTLINDVSTRLDTRLDNHDTSIATLNTLIQNLESSVGDLDTLTQGHTTDINNLESSVGGLDTLTRTHTSQIAQLDASVVRIDAYQAIQDVSIALAVSGTTSAWNGLTRTDNSIGLGGTLSQDTVINTSAYQLGVLGSMQISGDLTVDGSITYINTTELDVSDNIIQINTGLTGDPPVNMVSGMKVNRGDEDPYFFIFSEADDTFRIGINASEGGLPGGTQAVATREDSPMGTAVPFWNSSANRFDTNAGLTFAAASGLDVDNRITANLLTLQNIPNLASEVTALVIATDGSVGYRELGTNAFSSEAYALDSSLAAVRTLVNIHDASIGNIYVELGYADASTTALNTLIQTNITNIANLETSVGALDTLTQDHTAEIAQLDASIIRIDAYQAIQDASIVAVGGAWKPYVDGSLATRDSSIIALFAKNAAQDASIVRIDASLNDTIELFDVIDASFQELWDYNAIQDASIALAVSGTTSAWNGLTRTDNSIGLGGTLSQDTVINSSDYDFIIGGGDLDTQEGSYGSIALASFEKPLTISIGAGDANNFAGLAVGSDGTLSIYFSGGAIIADEASTGGLVYSDDYSATFQPNSLITKAFAESLVDEVSTRIFNAEGDIASLDASIVRIDGSIVNIYDYQAIQDASILALEAATPNVANGLQILSDGSIGLGGQLLESTTIDASDYVFWVGAGDFQGGNQKYSSISISSSQVYMDSGDPTAQVYIRLDSPGRFELNFNNSEIIDNGDGKGLVYSQDYSATFVANSLITKSFAESLVGEVSTRLSTAETDITNIETSLGILNNWNVSQDASIVTLRNTTLSALQTANNGLTANDTSVALGGALTHDTDIDATGYTFSVTGGLSVYGTLTVDGSVTYVNSVDLNVSDNIITVNYGETGPGVSKGVAGLKVDRGTEDDYVLVFSEATDTFRIGIANESGLPTGTQAVATREDTPEGFGIPFWNGSLYRFDTSSGFEFTPGVGLSLPIATNDSAEATALMITPAGLVVSRELGTMAFATATDYTLKTLFDSSVAAIWTKLGSVDTSIAGLDSLTQNHTTEINNLESSVGALDLLTQNHTLSISDLSTGKLDAVASTTSASGHQIYSTEVNNVAYVKKLVAGTGVSMTSDSSIITISADLTSGVLKYKGIFDGTSSTSLSIPAATHTLGTGPLSVTVYDGTQQVYVDVDCAANGDITLTWTGGSLSASCKYIIMG